MAFSSGPPLHQAAALPIGPEPAAARIAPTDARPQPARVTTAAAGLLMLPQTGPAADKSTTGLASPAEPTETLAPPPVVAEAESPPKPEKRAATPKRAKQARWGHGSTPPASQKPSAHGRRFIRMPCRCPCTDADELPFAKPKRFQGRNLRRASPFRGRIVARTKCRDPRRHLPSELAVDREWLICQT
jgi:hypothetical protein